MGCLEVKGEVEPLPWRAINLLLERGKHRLDAILVSVIHVERSDVIEIELTIGVDGTNPCRAVGSDPASTSFGNHDEFFRHERLIVVSLDVIPETTAKGESAARVEDRRILEPTELTGSSHSSTYFLYQMGLEPDLNVIPHWLESCYIQYVCHEFGMRFA